MKKTLILILLLCPVLAFAKGKKELKNPLGD